MFIHINFYYFSLMELNIQVAMRYIIGYVWLLSLALFSCGGRSAEQKNKQADSLAIYSVEPAPEWTELFNRTSGWFGGDGIFAIPFSGVDINTSDSIMFLFSDTMIGEIVGGALKPGYTMINNSVMILNGREPVASKAQFLTNANQEGKPSSLFVPSTASVIKDDYYWLGDGFVNHAKDSAIYILAYRIRNTYDSSAFPFREVGNSVIIIPKKSKYPFVDQRQLNLPFAAHGDSISTSFGVGVTVNTAAAGVPNPDEYVYVYGVRGKAKELIAARIKPELFENFSAWEFYNGSTWSSAFNSARPIADSVSNELSVTPLGNNKYALIYQYAGIMPTIYMQIGPSPVGPFGARQKVWNTADDIKEKDLFTYNAKAHPAISNPGELLVSYNVNSFNFSKRIEQIPNLYRPRFVRIRFDNNWLQSNN